MKVGNTLSVDYNLMDYQNGERKSVSHVDSEQDLGIWCTADLKPSFQCQQAVSKAMKVLGLIKRTFKIFNTTSLHIIQDLCSSPFRVLCTSMVTISSWRYRLFGKGSTQSHQTSTYYC